MINKSLTSNEEILKAVTKETSLIKKILYAYFYELDKTEYISEAKMSIDSYVEELNNLEDYSYFDFLLFSDNDFLSNLYFRKNLSEPLKKAVWLKLSQFNQITMEDYKSLPEVFQNSVVQSLIDRNQLKGSFDFIKKKIEKNKLLVKVSSNGELFQSIGFKDIDPQLLNCIGSEYSDYQELGYAQNNQDLESYRENLHKIKGLIRTGLIAFIREDNLPALRVTKRFGFKEIKKFKSPYSENTLIALALD